MGYWTWRCVQALTKLPESSPAPGRQPAYQVSGNGSGDECIRTIDQGPTNDQHY